MDNTLMNQIGLGGLDISYILIGLLALVLILFVLNIVALVKLGNLKKRYEGFMLGKNAKSMEKEIKSLFTDMEVLKEAAGENRKEIRNIYKRLKTTYQKMGIIKYDAFNQMGGKLSFALALLDEKDDGFVMNSVHSSDGSYCYIKVIIDGDCEMSLGTEEAKAIAMAMDDE